MTSRDFVIWLRGFTEACNDYTATPKQWDRIKELLENVEDYDDNPGIDVEVDGREDWYEKPDTFEDRTVKTPPSHPNPYWYHNPYTPPYYVGDPPGWLSPYSGTPPKIWDPTVLSGTVPTSGSSVNGILNTGGNNTTTAVWNDKMGNWHYTNYPEGFGYFTNSTVETKKEKQQLND